MIRVFISQPMRDKTNEQIKAERKRALDEIKALYPNEEIEEIQSFFEDVPHDATPLWFLGESIKLLDQADFGISIEDVLLKILFAIYMKSHILKNTLKKIREVMKYEFNCRFS